MQDTPPNSSGKNGLGCRPALRRFFAALSLALFTAAAAPVAAAAAEPPACAAVRLAETGWTDIAATTAIASEILQALGYKTESKLLSVPVTFSAMSTGEIDIFLGFWQPTMSADIKPYLDKGDVRIVRNNLTGARYGLAAPDYAYAAGLRKFSDIAGFAAALGGKIYGIEPGNDANRILLSMIDNNDDGLGQFRLVESSEQAMLSEVEAAIADKKPIVFLAWQPHPMNAKFHIAYLSGGDAAFGGGGGGAAVATVIRRGYAQQCPNIGRFLQNLSFTLPMEEALMDKILAGGEEPAAAARAWLRQNPAVWPAWLDGVTGRSGAPALPLMRKFLAAQ